MNDKIMTPEEIAERERQRLQEQENAAVKAYEDKRQAILSDPNAWHADGRKGLAIFDGVDENQTDIVEPIERKEPNPLDDYVKLVNDMWAKEDEEAAKKRQKAAKWITAAQMLGDSIAALGNSYFTAKGANAMTLNPGAPKAAAATYQLEHDIRNARDKAAKAQYDATLKKYEMEMRKADSDRAQANADRAHEENVRQFNERMAKEEQSRQDKLAEDARKQSNWEKEHKAKEDYNRGMLRIYGRRADIQQQNADTNATRATTASIRAAIAAGKKEVPLMWDANGVGATVHLSTDKLNSANLEQINLNLPDEIKKRYNITKYMRTADYDDKVLQAIGAELQAGNNAVYNILDQLGVLTLPSNLTENSSITMPGVSSNNTMPGV